jgi:hypothetical protein
MNHCDKYRTFARRTIAVAATVASTGGLAVATSNTSGAAPVASGAVLSGQVLSTGQAISGASVTLVAYVKNVAKPPLAVINAPMVGARHYVPPCTQKPCPSIETN